MTGFSVHNRIRTKAGDAEGRQLLARYVIRCPFALDKMRFDRKSGMVIYQPLAGREKAGQKRS